MFKNYKKYGGTYSKSTLPKPLDYNKFYVINLDDGPGTHWVLMYPMKNKRKYYYFDSFGGPPPEKIEPYIGMRNHFVLQHTLSSSCGYYIYYVVSELTEGKDFYDIMTDFTPSKPVKNEKKLSNYFK